MRSFRCTAGSTMPSPMCGAQLPPCSVPAGRVARDRRDFVTKTIAAWCAAAGLWTLPAQAQAQDDLFPDNGTLTVVTENDAFAGTDRNYTNGLRVAYLSEGRDVPRSLAGIAGRITGQDDAVRFRRGFAIGHSIFTPADIDAAEPLPSEHPYAGHVYVEYTELFQGADYVHQVALQVGLVGPSALGEEVQNGWHDLFGWDEAEGWDNQLDDELTVNVSYDVRRRAFVQERALGLEFDVTPTFGASLGNARTSARGGLTLRIGSDLGADYGPPRVRPALAGSGFFTPRNQFSWYVFAGAQGHAIAHNVVLDGSLFRDDDPNVDSNTFWADGQAGVAVQFGAMQVAYTYVHRTEEFEGQEGAQRFGAISLSRRF